MESTSNDTATEGTLLPSTFLTKHYLHHTFLSKLNYESSKMKSLSLIPGLASVTPSRRISCGGRSQATLQKRNWSRKSRLYFRLPAEERHKLKEENNYRKVPSTGNICMLLRPLYLLSLREGSVPEYSDPIRMVIS